MEADRRALVVGSGYAGVKHAEALEELGIRHARFAAAALDSASRERSVSVA